MKLFIVAVLLVASASIFVAGTSKNNALDVNGVCKEFKKDVCGWNKGLDCDTKFSREAAIKCGTAMCYREVTGESCCDAKCRESKSELY